MALLTSELRRMRYELGYNVLDVGAEPYIGVSALFESVIQTYMQSGATTTSTTTVAAASEPTPVTITLASATGFSAFDTVWVDVDSRQESATVQSVSGSTITLLLSLAHTGTYPVTVEGGEAIVRSILRKLVAIGDELGDGASGSAGIKRVDEIEFFQDSASDGGRTASLQKLRDYWRDELASALGIVRLNKPRGCGSAVALA